MPPATAPDASTVRQPAPALIEQLDDPIKPSVDRPRISASAAHAAMFGAMMMGGGTSDYGAVQYASDAPAPPAAPPAAPPPPKPPPSKPPPKPPAAAAEPVRKTTARVPPQPRRRRLFSPEVAAPPAPTPPSKPAATITSPPLKGAAARPGRAAMAVAAAPPPPPSEAPPPQLSVAERLHQAVVGLEQAAAPAHAGNAPLKAVHGVPVLNSRRRGGPTRVAGSSSPGNHYGLDRSLNLAMAKKGSE